MKYRYLFGLIGRLRAVAVSSDITLLESAVKIRVRLRVVQAAFVRRRSHRKSEASDAGRC
jgi:hypothetical protein